MSVPSEDTIRQVCEFAGLDPFADRQLVISALNANSGNVEAVIAAYYDSESKFRQTYAWSESPFFGDRDHADDSNVPSFTINAADESSIIHGVNPNHLKKSSYDGDFPYLVSAPPSRPPSRATSPVPHHNINGWINETSQARYGGPSSTSQEEEDLVRALAESAAMSGIHTPQETGITGAATMIGPTAASHSNGATATVYPLSGPSPSDTAVKSAEQDSTKPFFGPANRPMYNADDWAMTRIEPTLKDAKPSARTRLPKSPAYLASSDFNYLNAVLTVLHSIPAVRNALLNFGGVEAYTYGNNAEWWKGQPINPVSDLKHGPAERGKLILTDDGEETFFAPPEVDRDLNDKRPVPVLPLGTGVARQFIEEMQRLMAFLDGTERSYAYTESLDKAHLMTVAHGDDTPRRFCNALSYFGLADFNDNLFTGVRMTRRTGKIQETVTDQYMLLDLSRTTPSASDPLPCTSLYHMLDNAFWSYVGESVGPKHLWEVEDYKTAAISRMAPVHMFRVNTCDTGRNSSYQAAPYSLQGLSLEAAGLNEPLKTGVYARPPPIDIPETLYLDRYAEENQDWALGLQDKMRHIMTLLQELHTLITGAKPVGKSSVTGSASKNYTGPMTAGEARVAAEGERDTTDAVSLYQRQTSKFMLKLWNYKTKLLWQRCSDKGADFNSADVDGVQPETEDERRVFALIRAQLAAAKKQLKAHHELVARRQAEREAVWRLLTQLRKKRTEPTTDDPLKYKYKLRGVVVSSTRFYICRREQVPAEDVINIESRDDPIDVDADESQHKADSAEAGKTAGEEAKKEEEECAPAYRDQWWLIMHRKESSFVQKATLEMALRDAKTPDMQIVLAYCTEEAWTTEPDALSDVLKTFVKHDNRHFKTEREAERREAEQADAAQNKKRQQGTTVDDYMEVMTPIKRRNQGSSSVDSAASNASAGWSEARRSSIASDRAYAGDIANLSDHEMEDMPLLSRQVTNTAKAASAMAVAGATAGTSTLEPIIKVAELDNFNSEGSSEDFDDGGACNNACVQEAVLKSLQDQEELARKAKQTEEKTVTNLQSSPLGKSMVDLAISQENSQGVKPQSTQAAASTDPVMQQQDRVPKDKQYPKEKDAQAAAETERQFSTGVQLVADWDNPEGRYVTDDMDES